MSINYLQSFTCQGCGRPIHRCICMQGDSSSDEGYDGIRADTIIDADTEEEEDTGGPKRCTGEVEDSFILRTVLEFKGSDHYYNNKFFSYLIPLPTRQYSYTGYDDITQDIQENINTFHKLINKSYNSDLFTTLRQNINLYDDIINKPINMRPSPQICGVLRMAATSSRVMRASSRAIPSSAPTFKSPGERGRPATISKRRRETLTALPQL